MAQDEGPGEDIVTPEQFAKAVAARPFEAGMGGADFGFIPGGPSPTAWVYRTVSGQRKLVWSYNTVYTVGMEESEGFRAQLVELFGEVSRDNDDIIDVKNSSVVWIDRPVYRDGDEDPDFVDNSVFFSMISTEGYKAEPWPTETINDVKKRLGIT